MSFSQVATVSIAVGAAVSSRFTVGDFVRGSFRATAVVTGDINFDVSNDGGATWETLTNAASAFTSITSPGANLPRALPAALFAFRHARVRASVNQATVAGEIEVQLYGG